jgi:hypothetical protein
VRLKPRTTTPRRYATEAAHYDAARLRHALRYGAAEEAHYEQKNRRS